MSSDEGQLTNLYDLSRAQLAERLAAWGFSDYYAGLVWSGLYRDLVAAPADMVAVSYTHLDVYKRQASSLSKRSHKTGQNTRAV